MVMFLKALVIAVFFLYCTHAEETHSTLEFSADFETQSDEWIAAMFGDVEACPNCEVPSDEVEIVAEDPQHEALSETHSEVAEASQGYPPRNALQICKHLVAALREFEASHPQLGHLKKELKYKLRKYLPHFLEDIRRHKGDSIRIIIKFMDLLIVLAKGIKAECHYEPEVVPEVVPEPEYEPEYPQPEYVPEPEIPVPEYPEPGHLPEPVYPEPAVPCPEPEYVPEYPVPDVTYPEIPEPEYPVPEPEYVPEHPVPDVPHPEYPEPEYIPKPDCPEPEYQEEQVHDIYEDVELGSHISPGFVGSMRGIPGVHYPNYTEVPITSFSCADKKYIPGFYADLETGCQVFHVCYEHRRESFLCPLGTIFNQPILACDYWYSSNCSQAPLYYDVNVPEPEPEKTKEEVVSTIGALITTVIEGEKPSMPPQQPEDVDLSSIVKFLPVKAKVTIFKKPFKTVVASTVLNKIVPAFAKPVLAKPILKPLPLAKVVITKAKIAKAAAVAIPAVKVAAAVPVVKAKLVKTAAVPIAKFVVKAAAAPVVKAKFIKAVAAPVVKAKFIKAAAIPIKATIAAKATIPVAKVAAKAVAVPVKAKVFKVAAAKVATIPVAKVAAFKAAAVPIVKTKYMAAAIPAVKVAVAKAAAVPVVKAKFVAAPIFASKVAAAKMVPVAKFAAFKAVPIGKFAATAALAKPKIVAAGIPIVKAKFAAAAISPLTKKALAIGYMKLLKAKKFAVMG